MKWIMNDNITDEKVLEVSSNIDRTLLIARICATLNMTEIELYNHITEEEVNLLISSILINRNLDDKFNIDRILNNIGLSITNPYDLYNADLAATKIAEYCADKKAYIYIYADYDCDGITSGYVFTSAIREVSKGYVNLRYPNRKDGYGLSIEFCNYLIDTHCDKETKTCRDKVLVITVDNGITKILEVDLLNEYGIEAIITDHHLSKETVPNCIVVDPHNITVKQSGEFDHLCGCGIAFKVAQLVQEKFNVYNMMNYTPYLAIATLADVMPLTDENVALVQYGLEIINSTECPKGIQALKDIKKIDTLTANDILWTVAPMLNACGRMGDTELASKLFFLDEVATPSEIVELINKVNERRKTLTKNAQKTIEKMNFDDSKVCIYPTDEFPAGILGIIAGRISERFNKPSIVVSKGKNNIYHGSVRSANGINMVNLLKELKDLKLIHDFGGHAEACACGFDIKNLDAINKYFNERVTEDLYTTVSNEEPTIMVDEIISLNHLNDVVYTIVNMFPCDNRRYQTPTFALTDLQVVSFNCSKNNPDNICFEVKEGKKKMKIWAWGFAEKYLVDLECPDKINILGTIAKSFMNGQYTMNVVDIMAS